VISNGEDISDMPSWKRNISVVFQDLALFPHLNVGGNIAYGLFIRRVPVKERRRIIDETLKTVRLDGYAARRIHTLSGGERQRVAIARSLACNPRALLLDEPFSSLDAPLRRELREEFLEIRSHSRSPCIFVTHDREEAVLLGNRLALLDNGEIIESGTGKELFLKPKTEFAANFFGAGRVLPCKVLKCKGKETEVLCPLGVLNVSEAVGNQSKIKLFIPNDAVSLEDLPITSVWKSFTAKCSQVIYSGQNQVIKLELIKSDVNSDYIPNVEDAFKYEIVTGPRTRSPIPGSALGFHVNQSLLSFVKSS